MSASRSPSSDARPGGEPTGLVDAVATCEVWCAAFAERLAARRKRLTPQRRLIAETLFAHSGHLNLEELQQQVRGVDPTIGYATVYRTLKLLEEHELVHCARFVDGTTRYEASVAQDAHHDHLICTRCGAVAEFENRQIEVLQEQVAREQGYRLTGHRMNLFGLCPACQSA